MTSPSPESTDFFEEVRTSDHEETDVASEIDEESASDTEKVETPITNAEANPSVQESVPPARVLPPKLIEHRPLRIRNPPVRFGDKETYLTMYGTQNPRANNVTREPPEQPATKKANNPEPGATVYASLLNEVSDSAETHANSDHTVGQPQDEEKRDDSAEPENMESDSPDEQSDQTDEAPHQNETSAPKGKTTSHVMMDDGNRSSGISMMEMRKILKDKEEELRRYKRTLETAEQELSSLKKPRQDPPVRVTESKKPAETRDEERPETLDSTQVTLRAIQSLLEDSSERKTKNGMKDSQWTSDRKYLTDHWPVFKKHTDVIERVVGLSDWDAQIKNILSTLHELWRQEWDHMLADCKRVATERQKITSSKAVLLFPEDPDRNGIENKIRRVFADMLVNKQEESWFKNLSRREKDSPCRLLWTVTCHGLITTAHEMMELSNALGRQWPDMRSSEDLEEQIRRSEEAIECAKWYPSAVIPGMGERILLLDKATMSLGEIDRDIGTSYNVLTENMDFDLSQDENSKTKYYEAIVALVRKRSERKRYLGIQNECTLVSLPAVVADKPPQKKNRKGKGKGKGSKEEAPPPKAPVNAHQTRPQPQTTRPPAQQKPSSDLMCGTWHRWGFCPYMDRCRMAKSHTTSNKPPDAGCMCVKMLLDMKCDNTSCEKRHCPLGAEHFKNSKSGANLARVKARDGFDLNTLVNQKYTIIATGSPSDPKRCFNCGKEDHKQAKCTDPKMTCHRCGGDHKSNYCLEAAAWYLKEYPPLSKDFRKGRVAA